MAEGGFIVRFTLARSIAGALLLTMALTAVSGTASATPRPKKPGPPNSLTATAVNTAISVSWSPPAAFAGPAVSGYVVHVTPGHLACTLTSTTSCLATGLSNTKKYVVTVQAVNSVGKSRVAKVKKLEPNTSQNCNYFGPYGNLQGCNLSYDNLTGDNLSYSNLTNVTLLQDNLDNLNLTGADLAGASLQAATQDGAITDTPAALPSGVFLISGYLFGPDLELNNAPGSPFAGINFTGTGLSLAGTQLQSDDLSGDTFPAATDFASTSWAAT
jgi:hypothetical protein